MVGKPCAFALVAFICLYVISESRGGGYGDGGGYYYGGAGYGGGDSYKGSFYEKGVDPRLQQESAVDDLGFYDVNLQRYGKAVNVVASLVEICKCDLINRYAVQE